MVDILVDGLTDIGCWRSHPSRYLPRELVDVPVVFLSLKVYPSTEG